jgi:hypothetical protein
MKMSQMKSLKNIYQTTVHWQIRQSFVIFQHSPSSTMHSK